MLNGNQMLICEGIAIESMPMYSFSTYVIDMRKHIAWCLFVSKNDYSAVWVHICGRS